MNAQTTTLSAHQQRVWLLEQLQPGTPLHNLPLLLRLSGRLDTAALARALQLLVDRNPPLRTCLTAQDGSPLPVVTADAPVELELARGHVDEAELEAELRELARRPFEITEAPLLRATLGRCSEDEHLLLLVVHGAGWDSAAAGTLVQELSELYGATAGGWSVAVERVEHVHKERSTTTADLDYWLSELSEAPPLLQLPTDRPRPAAQSFRAAYTQAALPEETIRSLQRLTANAGASRSAVLLAALATVLWRYTGQRDLVIGTRVAGNVVPIRLNLNRESGLTFGDLVEHVDERLRQAERHPSEFEHLIEALDPERDLSRSPVFQVMFSIDEDLAAVERGGVKFQAEKLVSGATPYDLTVTADPCRTYRVQAEYSMDLFDADTIERFLGHLATMLASADRRTPLSALPILTRTEWHTLLKDWNATAAPYPRVMLQDLVAKQARRQGDEIAVEHEGSRLTYAELDLRANQLAHHLLELGVKPEASIGLCLNRSPELVVAMLGILKAGCTYIPLDPSYPPERKAFMLRDAQASLLVTEIPVAEQLPVVAAHRVLIDGDADAIASRATEPPPCPADPERLAYVIYTSGSTGTPKGVEITHRSVVNLLTHMSREPGLAPGDVVANLTTPAFDLSVPDWYLPLVCGARLAIAPDDSTKDGAELAHYLEAAEVTFAQATPTTWRLLVDAGWQGSEDMKIVCGGEPLSPTLANELLTRGELWHMYGPTETTVWSSIIRLERVDASPAIGGPISNTEFYVLDEFGLPVPIGVLGELFIGGDGVARGYRNRPDLTAERFVQHPFSTHGRRVYATGDRVRFRSDGTLEFAGRVDTQVKLRGFRIELGEVEATLAGHGDVREAVATVREDSPGDRRLVAYLVGEPQASLRPDELRRFLLDRLPAYMVPAAFVVLDALPSSANHKIDRSALPAPSLDRPELESLFIGPRTPVEELVAGSWAEVLGVERVGIQDDFFELGGNSLLATQVVARLVRATGIPLSLRTLFEFPTVIDLSRELLRVLAESVTVEEVTALVSELEAGSAAENGAGVPPKVVTSQ